MSRKKRITIIDLLKKDWPILKKKKIKKQEDSQNEIKVLPEHQQKFKTVIIHGNKMLNTLKTMIDVPLSQYPHDQRIKWIFRHYEKYKSTGKLELTMENSICNLNHLASFKQMLPFKMEINDQGNGIISVCLLDRIIFPLEYSPPLVSKIKLKLVAVASGFGETDDELVYCSQSFTLNFSVLTNLKKPFKPRNILIKTGAKPGNMIIIAASMAYEGILSPHIYDNKKYRTGALISMGKLK
jgi:hypothetical protein